MDQLGFDVLFIIFEYSLFEGTVALLSTCKRLSVFRKYISLNELSRKLLKCFTKKFAGYVVDVCLYGGIPRAEFFGVTNDIDIMFQSKNPDAFKSYFESQLHIKPTNVYNKLSYRIHIFDQQIDMVIKKYKSFYCDADVNKLCITYKNDTFMYYALGESIPKFFPESREIYDKWEYSDDESYICCANSSSDALDIQYLIRLGRGRMLLDGNTYKFYYRLLKLVLKGFEMTGSSYNYTEYQYSKKSIGLILDQFFELADIRLNNIILTGKNTRDYNYALTNVYVCINKIGVKLPFTIRGAYYPVDCGFDVFNLKNQFTYPRNCKQLYRVQKLKHKYIVSHKYDRAEKTITYVDRFINQKLEHLYLDMSGTAIKLHEEYEAKLNLELKKMFLFARLILDTLANYVE